jgi:MFS family permease
VALNGKPRLIRLPGWVKPTEKLSVRQRRILVLVGLASMSAAFINTLFTQTVAFAADEFDISQSGQGFGASVVRLGIVICLPLVAMADRYGRRPVMIAMAWAAPLVSALGAIAPSYVFLVGTQALGRPLGLTLDILIAVVAVEEMPRDTRAYATGLLAVVSGIGGGIAVGSLPLADLGPTSWRLIYVIALVWLFVAIALMKWLPESDRFIKNSSQPSGPRLRLKHAFRGNLGRICSVVFLTNLYIASASIFQNRFLKDDRGYSAALIALFTVVTSAPATVGLILGGHIADEKGRRILGATLVPVGALLIALSFSSSGIPMWGFAMAGGLAFGISYPALAVYRGELFSTGSRGMAGGIIMTAALLGGIVGLLGSGIVLDSGLSYGTVMLCLVLGPVVASLIVWFRYPETAHQELDEITHDF